MASRRDFLQLGLAASALPLAGRHLPTADRVRIPTLSTTAVSTGRGLSAAHFYRVIVDSRIAESVRFGERMSELGATIAAVAGDITDVWYHELYPRWKQEPVAIAGLTEHGPLFCLERLAWDHQMRVIYRAEHVFGRDCGSHELSVPPDMDTRALHGATDWAIGTAELVSSCQSATARLTPATVASTVAGTRPGERDPLYSWIIGPLSCA
jgi:hypothetical protein